MQICQIKRFSELRFYHFRNHTHENSCHKAAFHNKRRIDYSLTTHNHHRTSYIYRTIVIYLLECNACHVYCSKHCKSHQEITNENRSSVHSLNVLLITMQNYHPSVSTLDTDIFFIAFFISHCSDKLLIKKKQLFTQSISLFRKRAVPLHSVNEDILITQVQQ